MPAAMLHQEEPRRVPIQIIKCSSDGCLPPREVPSGVIRAQQLSVREALIRWRSRPRSIGIIKKWKDKDIRRHSVQLALWIARRFGAAVFVDAEQSEWPAMRKAAARISARVARSGSAATAASVAAAVAAAARGPIGHRRATSSSGQAPASAGAGATAADAHSGSGESAAPAAAPAAVAGAAGPSSSPPAAAGQADHLAAAGVRPMTPEAIAGLDLIVCIGGDGTVLHTSSLFQGPIPPVISVGAGSLGFMTVFDKPRLKAVLRAIFEGVERDDDGFLTSAVVTRHPAAPASPTGSAALADGEGPSADHLPPPLAMPTSAGPPVTLGPAVGLPLPGQALEAQSQGALPGYGEADAGSGTSEGGMGAGGGGASRTGPPSDAGTIGSRDGAAPGSGGGGRGAGSGPSQPLAGAPDRSAGGLSRTPQLGPVAGRSSMTKGLPGLHGTSTGGRSGAAAPFDGRVSPSASPTASQLQLAPLDQGREPATLPVTMRMRLRVDVFRAEGGGGAPAIRRHVLNELALERGSCAALSAIDAYVDGVPLTTIQADGVIIGTPTGSTAYSLAAGGSMALPSVPAILLTPICPHTLSFRPVLFPDCATIKLVVAPGSRSNVRLAFDGRVPDGVSPDDCVLRAGDFVVIRMSAFPLPLVTRKGTVGDWVRSITEKLNWNVRERQKAAVEPGSGADGAAGASDSSEDSSSGYESDDDDRGGAAGPQPPPFVPAVPEPPAQIQTVGRPLAAGMPHSSHDSWARRLPSGGSGAPPPAAAEQAGDHAVAAVPGAEGAMAGSPPASAARPAAAHKPDARPPRLRGRRGPDSPAADHHPTASKLRRDLAADGSPVPLPPGKEGKPGRGERALSGETLYHKTRPRRHDSTNGYVE